MIVQILWILLIAAILVYIYKTFKTEEEEYAEFKVLGYYLLGGFRVFYNNLIIPLGFVVFLLFMKPEKNQKMKKVAAVFGVIMLFLGYVMNSM